MGARGHIHIKMSAGDAAATARWLLAVAAPRLNSRADTILTSGYHAEKATALSDLAALLGKAASRKRNGDEFAPLVPREAAVALCSVGIVGAMPFHGSLFNVPPAAVRRVSDAAHQSMSGMGRGRPRLSDADVAAHLAGDRTHPRAIDPKRWPKRLKRRERIASVNAAWFDEVRERGETILTTEIPLPRI